MRGAWTCSSSGPARRGAPPLSCWPAPGPGSASWTRRASRGTRRAATSSGRGACRCSPTSRCPSPPGSTSATCSSSGRPTGRSSSPASTGPPTRGVRAPSPGACSTMRCARPRSMPAPNPSRAAPTSPSGPMRDSTASSSTAASHCTLTSSSGPTVRPATSRRSPRSWRSHGSCGGSPCGATWTSTSTCRPSRCGSRSAGVRFPATAGSSPAPTGAPTSASASGLWPTAGPARRRCNGSPPSSSISCGSGSSTARRRRRCRAGWADGSRWAWWGRCPPPGACCWSETPPDWSTPSKVRASLRP